jgi:hypothetical protein
MFTTSVPSPVNASPGSLVFTASRNLGGPVILSATPAQSTAVTYAGGGTPTWIASADQPWISVTAGSTAGAFNVSIVNPGDVIGAGSSLSGNVVILAPAEGALIVVPVTLTVLANGPSDALMATDAPGENQYVSKKGFQVDGWAIDRGSAIGSGIDVVHVWATPTGSTSGTATFLGAATVGVARPDVAAIFGAQFGTSGFNLHAVGLAPGMYRLDVFAHSLVANAFNDVRSINITVLESISDPLMVIDTPSNLVTLTPSFTISGWAIDQGALSGPGVDTVHIWAYPRVGAGFGDPTFLGVATYGIARPDVASFFGDSAYTNSGYRLTVTGMPAGQWRLVAFAHSTVANAFNYARVADITVVTKLMMVDTPADQSTLTQPFQVSGWAVDLAAVTGSGVDAVHVWAFPVGGGTQIFAGAATYGIARNDVGAYLGSSQFNNSGFTHTVTGLPPGQYDLCVFARSTVSGNFDNVQVHRVTVN